MNKTYIPMQTESGDEMDIYFKMDHVGTSAAMKCFYSQLIKFKINNSRNSVKN